MWIALRRIGDSSFKVTGIWGARIPRSIEQWFIWAEFASHGLGRLGGYGERTGKGKQNSEDEGLGWTQYESAAAREQGARC